MHFKPPALPPVSFPGEDDQDHDQPLQDEDGPAPDPWAANLDRWCQNDPSIHGTVDLGVDDELIRSFLCQYLRPKCFGSEVVLAYVRQFFPDFSPDEPDESYWKNNFSLMFRTDKAHVCQIMLDCCVVDPALDRSLPVAAGLEMARELRCLRHFETVLVQHLGMKTREVRAIKARTVDILADARRRGLSAPRH